MFPGSCVDSEGVVGDYNREEKKNDTGKGRGRGRGYES